MRPSHLGDIDTTSEMLNFCETCCVNMKHQQFALQMGYQGRVLTMALRLTVFRLLATMEPKPDLLEICREV